MKRLVLVRVVFELGFFARSVTVLEDITPGMHALFIMSTSLASFHEAYGLSILWEYFSQPKGKLIEIASNSFQLGSVIC